MDTNKQKEPYPEIAKRVISEKAKARWAKIKEAQRKAKLEQKRKEHAEWFDSLTRKEQWEHRQRLKKRYERDSKREGLFYEIKERLNAGEQLTLQWACDIGARRLQTMDLHPRTKQRIANFLAKWEAHKNDPVVRSGRPRKHPEK